MEIPRDVRNRDKDILQIPINNQMAFYFLIV